MCQLISNVDWEDVLNPLDLHNAWDYFSTTFDDIVCTQVHTFRSIETKEKYLYDTEPSVSKIRNANFGIDTW